MLSWGGIFSVEFVTMMSKSGSNRCRCLANILYLADVALDDINEIS